MAAKVTAESTSENTTNMIKVMCTRTVVPNHRPRLIGDQIKGSLIAPTTIPRGRAPGRSVVAPTPNLSVLLIGRNSSRNNLAGPWHERQFDEYNGHHQQGGQAQVERVEDRR